MIGFKSLFLLIEGYSEVKNRLISQGIAPDKVINILDLHKKYKNHFPEDMRNIETYFSKNNITKTGKDVVKLFNDLSNILANASSIILNRNQLMEKAKIAENDDYVLFKVNNHDEAVKLTRPGKNNPYGFPAQIPVTWCVAADSEEGQSAWDAYTGNTDDEYRIDVDNNQLVYTSPLPDSEFYFAFAKHPNNISPIYDYIAIQLYNNGVFKYTTAPNSDQYTGWPSDLPIDWEKLIKNTTNLKKQIIGPILSLEKISTSDIEGMLNEEKFKLPTLKLIKKHLFGDSYIDNDISIRLCNLKPLLYPKPHDNIIEVLLKDDPSLVPVIFKYSSFYPDYDSFVKILINNVYEETALILLDNYPDMIEFVDNGKYYLISSFLKYVERKNDHYTFSVDGIRNYMKERLNYNMKHPEIFEQVIQKIKELGE